MIGMSSRPDASRHHLSQECFVSALLLASVFSLCIIGMRFG
jgi:hypothetical protein